MIPKGDVVSSSLKYILLFKSLFIGTDTNKLRMCVDLLLIV